MNWEARREHKAACDAYGGFGMVLLTACAMPFYVAWVFARLFLALSVRLYRRLK